ncbi:hypothetical protein BB560_006121, partial [Smittium megazygosporum]
MNVENPSTTSLPDHATMSKVWETLDLVYSTPTVVSASISSTKSNENLYAVEYTTKQTDFVRDVHRQYSHSSMINLDSASSDHVVFNSSPTELVGTVLSAKSDKPGSSLKVVLKSVDSSAGGKKANFVEIWNGSCLAKNIPVSDSHGEFYSDVSLGGLDISPSEKYIVYVAEPKEIPKSTPRGYVKAASTALNSGKPDEPLDLESISRSLVGLASPHRYKFNEDFGETYTGKRPPTLVVVDIQTEEVSVIDCNLFSISGISPGQPTWVTKDSGDECIVFTGYNTKSRNFGLIYTQNRPSDIYMCSADGRDLVALTDGSFSVRSPRATPDKKTVVYLASAKGGPHAGSARLVQVDIVSRQVSEIIPFVFKRSLNPTELLPSNFPGLYSLALPEKPWLTNSSGEDILFVNSINESSDVVYAVNIKSNKVSELGLPSGKFGSLMYLSSCNNIALFSYSTPSSTQDLVCATLDFGIQAQSGAVSVSHWTCLNLVSKDFLGSSLIRDGIDWEVLEYPERTNYLQTVLTKPKGKPLISTQFTSGDFPPLVIFPHGGPHVTYTAGINLIPTLFTLLGFVVAQVNYTGSLGFGQESIDLLVGNIGNLEVEEIVFVAKDLVKKGVVDGGKLVYSGGSHSGFTGAHLAGRFPGLFKALVIRNPAISIGEMFAKTDIPDWCFSQLGLEYNFDMSLQKQSGTLLTPEAYAKMWEISPQRYALN